MKTIKTHHGIRRIDELDTATFLFQLRELLTDYRASLISRLMEDLATYVDYKFHFKPDINQIPELKIQLYSLKISRVDLGKYQNTVRNIMTQESSYLSSEPFYTEIDEHIHWYLQKYQLTLVA